MKARLEQAWGRERLVATSYDWGVQNPVVGRVFAQGWWGAKLDLIAAIGRIREAAAGSRVLDVPCGGGLPFPALQHSARLDYTALDFSPVMLERAQNHHDGGRGVYFRDPAGHYLEIITRPYGSGG